MKERYSKLLGRDLYIKEVKEFWWSPWKVVKIGGLLPVAFRRVHGEFVEEWEHLRQRQWNKLTHKDIALIDDLFLEVENSIAIGVLPEMDREQIYKEVLKRYNELIQKHRLP